MVLGTVAACGGEVEVTKIVEREVKVTVEVEGEEKIVEVTREVEVQGETEMVEVTRIVEGESMIVEVTRQVEREVEVTVVVEPTATIPPDVGRQVDDNVVLVFDGEPASMFFPHYLTAISDTAVRDNLVDPLTWQSGVPEDNLKLVPTTLTTGWENIDPNTWRFNLREGVKFHNGEEWNAQAAIPSFTYQGSDVEADSRGYTGDFTPVAIDDYTLEMQCVNPCAILPRVSVFLAPMPPQHYESMTVADHLNNRTNYSVGPYQFKEWDATQLVFERYDDYVEVEREDGSIHPEFQKAVIPEVRWQWRAERLTQASMIAAGEADMAWDVGIDAAEIAPAVKTGGAAETLSMKVMTLGCNWHPELCKREVRLAIAHSINCAALRDNIYNGLTTCRGTNEWLGVVGVTAEADAPHEYNPELSKQLLADAGYDKDDPGALITINSRAFRVTKGNEIYEAISNYMTQVGIRNQMVIQDRSLWLTRSSCGAGKALRAYLDDQGMEDVALEAATPDQVQAAMDRGPVGVDCIPGNLVTSTLSDEQLDFQRSLLRNMSCTNSGSYFCEPELAERIQEAIGTPEGDLRFERMQYFHDRLKNEALNIGVFDLGVVYAINPRLVWEPRFDRRVRVNSMEYAQ
jgi:ABC-type transport system substrate-binding protein